jgi:hypothetical protein
VGVGRDGEWTTEFINERRVGEDGPGDGEVEECSDEDPKEFGF